MYKKLLLLFFIFSTLAAAAQDGKIFYDENWQVTKKRKADWYRLYTLENGIYKIEDHYIDGPIYMSGSRTTIESNSCNYRIGPIVFYDRDGRKLREGQYVRGVRTGLWRHYYKGSEAIRSECHYASDTGEHMDYSMSFDSATQRVRCRTIYQGEKTIEWSYTEHDSTYSETTDSVNGPEHIRTTRYKDHSVVRVERINDANKKSTTVTCYDESGAQVDCDRYNKKSDTSTTAFTYVEQMPENTSRFNEYLARHLHYPKEARRANIEGRVIIKFVVDEDGAVSNCRVIKGIGGGCDEEALRVISEMPYWRPGYQNGVAVRVYFTLPLVFKLK